MEYCFQRICVGYSAMNSSTAYANVLDVHLFQSISYKNQLFSGISYILKIRDSKGEISVNCTNKLNTDKIILLVKDSRTGKLVRATQQKIYFDITVTYPDAAYYSGQPEMEERV